MQELSLAGQVGVDKTLWDEYQQELRLQRVGRQGRNGSFCHRKKKREICEEGGSQKDGEVETKWNAVQ